LSKPLKELFDLSSVGNYPLGTTFSQAYDLLAERPYGERVNFAKLDLTFSSRQFPSFRLGVGDMILIGHGRSETVFCFWRCVLYLAFCRCSQRFAQNRICLAPAATHGGLAILPLSVDGHLRRSTTHAFPLPRPGFREFGGKIQFFYISSEISAREVTQGRTIE